MNHSENENKICAVIPFYNEHSTLKEIVKRTLPFVDRIILINDGSTDEFTNQIPVNGKVILISHENNLGKGAALKTGLLKSIELKSNISITLDADLQHDPQLIPIFVQEITNYDCLIGKRDRVESDMPIHRRLSNYLTSTLLSLKTKYKIEDSQSGFRAFRTEILKDILPTFSGFEAESEMIVKLCKKNFRLSFINIPTIYGNDNSKMKAVPAIIGFIKVMLKT
ncbi:MAG: glycosyltransferase family 2 protein [Ignavibacteriales bacterium]|nr:glycosyltransferase family 2 protein [Ignavibacteriales bacterium]